MLTLTDGCASAGQSRRDFLRIGGLGLAGWTLPDLLRARASAAQPGRPVTGKSVVFLFLQGGPPQTETFDPKMTAPPGIRSVTGEVKTAIPGVTFGSTLVRLAKIADRLAVVRSFSTGDGNHDAKPLVSRTTAGASLGAYYARIAGGNHPKTGMPMHTALFPRAVEPSAQKANRNFGDISAAGALGASYAAFVPGRGGSLQEDMRLQIPRTRLDDRRHLLARLDRMKRTIDSGGQLDGVDRFRQQAYDTILGGVADALDLSKEDPRTIARFDTAPLVRPDQISRKWNNYNNYVDNAKSLGKLLLLARRLCEAGCGFVTVTTNFVWDMHADQNNAGVEEGMRYMGVPLDFAVSAFIEDTSARGLDDDILLVVCGEMGRTPRVNNRGGRDHWGRLAPLLLAGGGLKMGQVVGQSSADAGEPRSEPITMQHLYATIMDTALDVGAVRLLPGIPNEVIRLTTAGEKIPHLS